jgi:hypothetical protein
LSKDKNASIDGKPGIVESPGKLIIAFSMSLSVISSVAGSSYCSLYKKLSSYLIDELIGSLEYSLLFIPFSEFLYTLRNVATLFQA